MAQRRARPTRLAAAIAATALLLAACGSDDEPTSTGGGTSADGDGDTGATLTMWARSVTAPQTEALVEAYNASHENQIELTVVPFDSYLQKVTAAAGGGELPDLLAANVVEAPNYAQLGLWQDIGDRIDALDYADALAPSHIDAGTVDDQRYAVPHVVDTSALYVNTKILEAAGVDPADPAPTLQALADNIATIQAASPGTQGLYLAGNCGGCLVFTVWPSIWASGGEVLDEDGTESLLDQPEALEVFEAYNQLFADGAIPEAARNEAGPTQNEPFASGQAAFSLLGSKALATIPESDALSIGVVPIPGVDGGRSSFVGGDVLGISSSSEQADAAWDFVQWTLSDEAQLEVMAKNKNLTVRTDLASNQYSEQDPRLVLLNELVGEGRTPYAGNFFQTFNDPNGPGLPLMRAGLFGDDPAAEVPDLNGAVNDSLQRN
ncbi:ABC transporter substrate-binding protein [Jiangella alba]|uniref:Multiple sugar transport system substrate-binding protein n=1 Tax=Jiangella alba TaxID=561176 RepID=A0A1H5PPY2_9ACTN|nr:sugar ABC transporter substrate-binding protein [Jiangella alba]SEF15278.1 multiple sugar transport system substrate-binding protein [Jiangella alba]